MEDPIENRKQIYIILIYKIHLALPVKNLVFIFFGFKYRGYGIIGDGYYKNNLGKMLSPKKYQNPIFIIYT